MYAMNDQLLFWDVDTQIDFMDPGGKLYVFGAENVIDNVRRLNHWAADNGVLVVSSVDAHLPSDAEFQQYTPHCLVGTRGQQKVSGTLLPHHLMIPNQRIELPAGLLTYQQIVIEKQALDVFTNPNIEELLAKLGPLRVILYGVVTEICVDKAARGLLLRGFRVDVVGDAIQHLNADQAQCTLDKIRQHGGRVLTTDEIVSTPVLRPA
jgi:nicotinamidase/pyrazinamidase